MSVPNVQRDLKPLEKHRVWLIIGGAGTLFMCCISTTILVFGSNLRGYTGWGLFLGIMAVVFTLLTFVYSLRKRAWQEKMPATLAKRRGTMMMWMWAHVYLGVLAFMAAVFHAGSGLLTFDLTTGKLLYFVFFLIIFSGVGWRLIYRFVPERAMPEIGNYSQEATIERAQSRRLEMEKLAAGKSETFHQIKEWLIDYQRPLTGLDNLIAQLPADEQTEVPALKKLAESQARAYNRYHRQAHYTNILQGARWVHIPLIGLFVVFLVWHIIGAFDILPKMFPAAMSGFHPAEDCAQCHQAIYDQWRHSMHAHALTSPVTIVQNNQVVMTTLADTDEPDPKRICINCHAPVGAILADGVTLPLEGSFLVSEEFVNEGVNCATCHQFKGESVAAGGGWTDLFLADLRAGSNFSGPYDDAVGNPYHHSETTTVFENPEILCLNCHNVNVDLDGDGEIVAGPDLVLQNTFSEYLEYRENGGTQTCLDCHMPIVPGQTRAAESASIPFEQDFNAPDRIVRDHSFVGVDYPINLRPDEDPQRAQREALLESAALMDLVNVTMLDSTTLSFEVLVTNNDLGHYLPTGFAFSRQMWLEVVVTDDFGNILFTSGVINSNTDDLCDANTMDDPGNPMAQYIIGCDFSDSNLVNFQQKLVSDVDLVDGRVIQVGQETWLQGLEAGAVARVRSF